MEAMTNDSCRWCNRLGPYVLHDTVMDVVADIQREERARLYDLARAELKKGKEPWRVIQAFVDRDLEVNK